MTHAIRILPNSAKKHEAASHDGCGGIHDVAQSPAASQGRFGIVDDSAEMVRIPGGRYVLDAPSSLAVPKGNQLPPSVSVWIDVFDIDRNEVTAGQYGACVAAAQCKPTPTKYPACNEHVSLLKQHPIN